MFNRIYILLKYIILSQLFTIQYSSFAQTDSLNLIKYTPEFRFRDGFFLNFDQVKSNKPIPFAKIEYPASPIETDFVEKVLNENKIAYFDQFGIKATTETSKLWGYSKQGVLFIQYEKEFVRIPVFGKISHFVATVIVENQVNNDPYLTNSYYYDPTRNTRYTSREMLQFILDFTSGKVYLYDRESLKLLLMTDTTLYDEFNSLSKRKQKKMLFYFLRKFNERNPVFFPKN